MERIMKGQRGFTLVELAMVLVIIGLILGAVMKGQALIQQAKVKKTIAQVDGIRAAVLTFYDRYGQYPGDEALGGAGNTIPANDDNAGNGDGQINGNEYLWLFRDLQLAEIISGNYDRTPNTLPRHPFGDIIVLYWTDPPPAAATPNHWFRLDNLPWDVALEIDTKLDDAVYDTGSVVATAAYAPASGNIASLYIRF
ncbi:MAG: prepilin-type N-terminal cleavage/methylation domain-containing protein [Deltaproteobacteria bacterium]